MSGASLWSGGCSVLSPVMLCLSNILLIRVGWGFGCYRRRASALSIPGMFGGPMSLTSYFQNNFVIFVWCGYQEVLRSHFDDNWSIGSSVLLMDTQRSESIGMKLCCSISFCSPLLYMFEEIPEPYRFFNFPSGSSVFLSVPSNRGICVIWTCFLMLFISSVNAYMFKILYQFPPACGDAEY